MKKSKIILSILISTIVLLGVSCSNTETLENESTPKETTDATENVAVDETENNKDLVGEKITEIDESLVVSEMSGRYDYKVMQKDDMHYLVWEDEKGEVQSALLGDRTGLYSDETKSNKTVITRIQQTVYSDIVSTQYVYSGAILASENAQVYVNPNNVVVSNIDIYNHTVTVEDEFLTIGTLYLDDRVALLNDNIVEIYDDKTGALIQEIDGEALYGSQLNDIFEFDGNGEIYNIQGVGEEFLVVNMLQPNTLIDDEIEKYVTEWYYTTIINLETMEMIPVYEQFNCFKERLVWIDGEMARPHVSFGSIPSDTINFVEVNSEGQLVFESNYYYEGEYKTESVTISYK